MTCHISIVIPAYNEALRILPTLNSVWTYFDSQDYIFEIIVVDDGSADNTSKLVEEFARSLSNVRLLTLPLNKGKGFAVRRGVAAAQGAFVLINDADGSSPIGEVAHLFEAIDETGADIAIGSRNKPKGERKTRTVLHRKLIGNTFNLIVQQLLLPGIHDTQCGFKLFKRDVAKTLFQAATEDRFAFDVEILYAARLLGYKIEEVSIEWTNVAGSKVNLIFDSLDMLVNITGIAVRTKLASTNKSRTRRSQDFPLQTSERTRP